MFGVAPKTVIGSSRYNLHTVFEGTQQGDCSRQGVCSAAEYICSQSGASLLESSYTLQNFFTPVWNFCTVLYVFEQYDTRGSAVIICVCIIYVWCGFRHKIIPLWWYSVSQHDLQCDTSYFYTTLLQTLLLPCKEKKGHMFVYLSIYLPLLAQRTQTCTGPTFIN